MTQNLNDIKDAPSNFPDGFDPSLLESSDLESVPDHQLTPAPLEPASFETASAFAAAPSVLAGGQLTESPLAESSLVKSLGAPSLNAPKVLESSEPMKGVVIPPVSKVIQNEHGLQTELPAESFKPVEHEDLPPSPEPQLPANSFLSGEADDDLAWFSDEEGFWTDTITLRGETFFLKELDEAMQNEANGFAAACAKQLGTTAKNFQNAEWRQKNMTYEQSLQLDILSRALVKKVLDAGLVDWTLKSKSTGQKRPCAGEAKHKLPWEVRQLLSDRIISLGSGMTEEEFFRLRAAGAAAGRSGNTTGAAPDKRAS